MSTAGCRNGCNVYYSDFKVGYHLLRIINCLNCDYNSEALYCWGGKLFFQTYCAYSVVDLNTDEVKIQNIIKKDEILVVSDTCIFCDTENIYLKKRVEQGYYFRWAQKVIYRGDVYICPKCHKYSMEFLSVGMWD